MSTWAPWRRSTRGTTGTTRKGGAGNDEEILLAARGRHAKKVSSEIIDQIKRGDAPWQKPWKPGELLKPMSFELEGRDG